MESQAIIDKFVPVEPPISHPHTTYRHELQEIGQILESLEKEASETGVLLRQLSNRLDIQLRSLNDLRQAISEITQAVPPIDFMNKPVDGKAPLRIYCLGPFTIYWGNQQVSLRRGSKDGQILKYLACNGAQPVKRDVLLEVLWPETDPQIANNRLKVTMHHLRQVLPSSALPSDSGDCVLYEQGYYFFNPEINVWSDVAAFEQNWQKGLKHERAGRLLDAVACFSQAEALYRGDFLEEDPLEEWTLVKREAMKDTYLEILDKVSHYWFATNNIEPAVMGWKKIIIKDPWREDTYRNLMTCFARLGQRARALKWYDTCLQTLRVQLGIDPEPETIELYERIRCGGLLTPARSLQPVSTS